MGNNIGNVFMFNFIILFLFVAFGFLGGTVLYYKNYVINNNIIHVIEKYEGYNDLAKEEIPYKLANIGYSIQFMPECKDEYRDMYLSGDFVGDTMYCIYVSNDNPADQTFYRYGVLTYMTLDMPIINLIKLPVFTKTNQIFKFSQN